ncbi:hypothetical protein COO91_00924 [Nostoc flagelliforme CCNUN1]|uniref:Uncharacterized protein n=1 Tax=Nostoc flagelliforme CCNUN1 TaxID=2038116 RepID=A0A2K8SIB0_9NOSO|nr:hypothetical protein COO91_00924 [Nostoc flagelliforme CCNUN1]
MSLLGNLSVVAQCYSQEHLRAQSNHLRTLAKVFCGIIKNLAICD